MVSLSWKKKIRGWTAGLALASGLASPLAAAGPEVRFEMRQPFQVAAHRYASGTIAVRSVGSDSRSGSLVEVWVDGSRVGTVNAQRRAGGTDIGRDEALFRRDGEGRLVMVGYSVSGDRAGATYRFENEAELTSAGSTLAEAHTPTSRR